MTTKDIKLRIYGDISEAKALYLLFKCHPFNGVIKAQIDGYMCVIYKRDYRKSTCYAIYKEEQCE